AAGRAAERAHPRPRRRRSWAVFRRARARRCAMSTGQIHDLGYKRYVGSRRSFETRWLVIMRHQLATSWRGWWRYKAWLICGLMATATSGCVLYILSGNIIRAISGIAG